ncbi:replication stress response regulator SDE2 [Cyclopterus lumpus]|uniref:SDE2 telomere maintenance homolog (S. pombe) n=1 Tax=Cyclopterus lumpus TaxID=8103 RepID=A0A8C2Z5H6_CYCLU|nr:replication stress response regulator SDE2 [Cyclopterus lumpus]
MEVFVSAPGSSFSNCVFPDGSQVRDVLTRFVRQQGGGASADFYVVRNGRVSPLEDPLHHGAVYHLEPRLRGGKGGFGSMLRALGAQIEKTTNREACRDLSGRRLRDVNHEKEMAEWLKNQTEREAEKEQRRLERLQRKLAEPKHQFTDPEYQRQCHDLSERLEDSVMKGLQASSSSQVKVDDVSAAKRPNCDQDEQLQKKKQKKKNTAACFWTGVGEMLSSEDEDEEEEQSGSSASDHQTSRTAGDQGLPETPRDQTVRPSEDKGRPETPRDQTSRPPEDQSPPETPRDQTSRPSETPSDQTSKPSETPKNQTSRPSEDQSLSQQQDWSLVDQSSVDQLESLGLDVLKEELMSRGLKCGGTLKERAQRLFSIRGLTPNQIDPAMLAKPAKTRRK